MNLAQLLFKLRVIIKLLCPFFYLDNKELPAVILVTNLKPRDA